LTTNNENAITQAQQTKQQTKGNNKMNTMIANPTKWYTAEDGALDTDFIRQNEVVESRGRIHRPISSAIVLDKFRERAKVLGLRFKNEQAALLKRKVDEKKGVVGGDRYMYIAEVEDDTHPDYALSVGFRNFSDKSLAFSGMCESHIFVCENGVCHGIVKPSKVRHTIGNIERNTHLLDDKIDTVFQRFLEDGKKIHEQIALMGSTKLTDDIVARFVKGANGEWIKKDDKWTFVKNPLLGSANLLRILEDLENPERNDRNDNSVMRLMNSASHITSHTITNPNQSMLASNFCNNLIMKILKDDFVPLGDVVEAEVIED